MASKPKFTYAVNKALGIIEVNNEKRHFWIFWESQVVLSSASNQGSIKFTTPEEQEAFEWVVQEWKNKSQNVTMQDDEQLGEAIDDFFEKAPKTVPKVEDVCKYVTPREIPEIDSYTATKEEIPYNNKNGEVLVKRIQDDMQGQLFRRVHTIPFCGFAQDYVSLEVRIPSFWDQPFIPQFVCLYCRKKLNKKEE